MTALPLLLDPTKLIAKQSKPMATMFSFGDSWDRHDVTACSVASARVVGLYCPWLSNGGAVILALTMGVGSGELAEN